MNALKHIGWDLALTVSHRNLSDPDAVYNLVQSEIIRPLSKRYKTQLVAVGVVAATNRNHSHYAIKALKSGVLETVTNDSLHAMLTANKSPLGHHRDTVHLRRYNDEGWINYLKKNFNQSRGLGAWVPFNCKALNKLTGFRPRHKA